MRNLFPIDNGNLRRSEVKHIKGLNITLMQVLPGHPAADARMKLQGPYVMYYEHFQYIYPDGEFRHGAIYGQGAPSGMTAYHTSTRELGRSLARYFAKRRAQAK